MDTPAPTVPATSWRAEITPSGIVGGSSLIQPNRMDVLVHLLALEQLGGARHDDISPDASWLVKSEAFTALDNEIGVVQLAAELLTSPSAPLEVSFASGGQIVRGASVAAAVLYSESEGTRIDGREKPVDRSVDALREAGWTDDDLHELLLAWSRRDATAAVVILDMEADGWEVALHELSCRYQVMHTEIDYVSPLDAERLSARGAGSSQIVCLRAAPEGLRNVLSRHAGAVAVAKYDGDVRTALEDLWSPERERTTSSTHEQRRRKMRRRQLAGQLLDRARGR